jgi:hypothetical protein
MLDREGEIRQKEVLTCGLYNEKWSEGLIGLGATVCTTLLHSKANQEFSLDPMPSLERGFSV